MNDVEQSNPASEVLPLHDMPRPVVTWTIIALNLAVFAWCAWRSKSLLEMDDAVLLQLGMDSGELVGQGQVWRLLASAFLHAGLLHIACNLWFLRAVGPAVESLYGRYRFTLLYVLSAIAASLASIAWRPNGASVGASGALFALIGALIAFFVRHRERIPPAFFRERIRSLLILVVINVAFGLSIPRIDNAAHIGGLTFGFLFGLFVGRGALGMLVIAGALLSFGATAFYRVRHDPWDEAERRVKQGWEHLEKNDPKTAETDADAGLEQDSDMESALELRVWARREQGNETGAVADLDRLIELEPSNGRAVLLRGHILYDLGEWAKAQRDFEVAPSFEHDFSGETHIFEWFCRAHLGGRDVADRELRAWLTSPSDAGSRLERQIAAYLVGDVDESKLIASYGVLGSESTDDGSEIRVQFAIGEKRWITGDRKAAVPAFLACVRASQTSFSEEGLHAQHRLEELKKSGR